MSQDWVLKLQPPKKPEHLEVTHENTLTINRKTCGELNYNDFFWNHVHANWPVVLTDVSNSWHCRQYWTHKSCDIVFSDASYPTTNANDTAINYDYLRVQIGNCKVPVANCSREYFNSHMKLEMSFHEYLDYWQKKSQQVKDCNEVANENGSNLNSNFGEPTVKEDNLYLKDWHLKAQMPDYDFYTVPKYFASDWLNEYLVENGKDDYRFVYMGPKDSWTPFHADVFGSYSWSTNIVGCKRWLLLPPGEEACLIDKLGNVPLRITEELLREHLVRHFIINQKENESIFVPSGWYHQVHNITDTISVNHNWLNGCNIQQIWKNLAFSMQQVIAEIEDCRQMENFDEHCQTMLCASFGLNFYDFLDILEYIAKKRLHSYTTGQSNNNDRSVGNELEVLVENSANKNLHFAAVTMNEYHLRYDLHCINAVVQEMLQNYVISKIPDSTLYRRCLSLKELTNNF